MNTKKMIAIIAVFMLLVSCSSSVSKEEAESIAKGFIETNVKFFAKGGNASSLVDKVEVPSATSYKEGDVWVVVVHISSMVEGIEKKNDLIVKVSREGKVIEFNGKKLENA